MGGSIVIRLLWYRSVGNPGWGEVVQIGWSLRKNLEQAVTVDHYGREYVLSYRNRDGVWNTSYRGSKEQLERFFREDS
jgi:hypothetical protein